MYWPGHLFLEFLCTSGRTVMMNHQFHAGGASWCRQYLGYCTGKKMQGRSSAPMLSPKCIRLFQTLRYETQTSLWDRGSLDAYVNINATFRSVISTALGVLRTYSSKLKQSTAVTLIRLLASVNKALISSVALPKSLLQVSFGKLKQNFPSCLL